MVDWDRIAVQARDIVVAARAPEAARFLKAWPAPGGLRVPKPTSLGVLRWLGVAAASAPPGPLSSLARAVAAAAPLLAWRQTYDPSEVAASFLERYGWCELIGATGPIPSAALAAGVLLLGPGTHYPPHAHVAEELYVPLSGTAQWSRGHGGDFESRQPGEPIFHASGESHAMRTGAAPLLALYLWQGAGLGEPARLESS